MKKKKVSDDKQAQFIFLGKELSSSNPKQAKPFSLYLPFGFLT